MPWHWRKGVAWLSFGVTVGPRVDALRGTGCAATAAVASSRTATAANIGKARFMEVSGVAWGAT